MKHLTDTVIFLNVRIWTLTILMIIILCCRYRMAQFFDGGNIDGQHPRPPVLVILLEIIERESFDALLA